MEIGDWEINILSEAGDFDNMIGKVFHTEFINRKEERKFPLTISFLKKFTPEFFNETLVDRVKVLESLLKKEKEGA